MHIASSSGHTAACLARAISRAEGDLVVAVAAAGMGLGVVCKTTVQSTSQYIAKPQVLAKSASMSFLSHLSSVLAISTFLSFATFGYSDTVVSQPNHLQERGFNNPYGGGYNPGNYGGYGNNGGYGNGAGGYYPPSNSYTPSPNGYAPPNNGNTPPSNGYNPQPSQNPSSGTQRPVGTPRCMGENYLNLHQCNVAVNKFPYTQPNGVIRSDRKRVTSKEGSCRVVLLCPGPVILSSGRILHDTNGQGGYQKLVDTCGTQRGIITLEGGCTVEVQNSSHK